MTPLIARRRGSFSRGGCTTQVERADRLLGDRRGAPADRPSRVGVYLFGRLAQIAANERTTTPLFPERQPERLVPVRRGTGVANARTILTAQRGCAYHCGMRGASAHWTLVFTVASLEHLAE